jgi:hypothetical protein
MSYGSQLTTIIIHYTGITGLMLCSLLSLFLANKKKKMLFLFLSFIFGGILYFVNYSGILVFIIGIIMIFFFILLYLFVFQLELFGNDIEAGTDNKPDQSKKKEIITIITALLFCSAIGYFLYVYTSRFLRDAAINESILITTLSDISSQLSVDYSLVIIILAASLFISSIWLIIIKMEKK